MTMLLTGWEQQLILGQPIKVDFFYVKPWKLKDILNPENEYYFLLSLLFIEKDLLGFKTEFLEELKNANLFELIKIRCLFDESFKDLFIKCFSSFIPKSEITYIDSDFLFDGEKITDEHFEVIKQIISTEIARKEETKEEYNFADDKARALYEKIKKTKEQVNKIKEKQQKDTTLDFLINRFCAKSNNISLLEVGELTQYQLIKQLEGILSVENYQNSFQAMISGAWDKNKNKLIHWTENSNS